MPIRVLRSALNPLLPLGVGERDTESLHSYFFRLALSHCISAPELKRTVTEKMKWRIPGKYRWDECNLNGMGSAAERWSQGLSELTCIAHLDMLTLLPWRNVIAQKSLSSTSSRWCSVCFAQDRADGRTPYLRLAWDIGEVAVCPIHETWLTNVCPNCGRSNTRNSTSYVVPGWCCFCGEFLGNWAGAVSVSAAEIWKACQIGAMLAAQSRLSSTPTRDTFIKGLFNLVICLDDGKNAVFARRIGLNRSTVHYWLKEGGIPTIAAHLRIASQTGLSLPSLLTGKTAAAQSAPIPPTQLTTLFPGHRKRVSPRSLDVGQINDQLEAFILSGASLSVGEAARRLNVHPRQLYEFANRNARIMGQTWKRQQRSRGEENRKRAAGFIEAALLEIVAEGKGASLRELRRRIPKDVLGSVRDIFTLLEEVKVKLGTR
ncbi:TniQ family protein [Paraburkholderia agricolaris]|uniref:TniQ family protein n=1 Tax=Paraburkholderia agricolaris TaxID=2152888 RepID=A0ABW8ZYP8_9BURK